MNFAAHLLIALISLRKSKWDWRRAQGYVKKILHNALQNNQLPTRIGCLLSGVLTLTGTGLASRLVSRRHLRCMQVRCDISGHTHALLGSFSPTEDSCKNQTQTRTTYRNLFSIYCFTCPAVSVRPEWTMWTLFAFGIVNAFFMRTTNYFVHHCYSINIVLL